LYAVIRKAINKKNIQKYLLARRYFCSAIRGLFIETADNPQVGERLGICTLGGEYGME
jgi:hypothetical protein